MTETKLFEFLKIIKGSNRRDLESFIFVSSNQLSVREKEIMSIILKDIGSRKKLIEENFVKNHLRPQEISNWNRIKSHLLKVLYRYWVMNLAFDAENSRYFILSEFFLDNDLNRNLKSTMKKRRNCLSNNKIDRLNNLYKFWHKETEVKIEKESRKQTESLNVMIKHLDDFYFENRLRCLCEQLNRGYIINEVLVEDHLIIGVEARILSSESIGVRVFYHLYKMLVYDDDQIS